LKYRYTEYSRNKRISLFFLYMHLFYCNLYFNFNIKVHLKLSYLLIIQMKKKLFTIAFILSLLVSCKVTRFVVYNFADINDHKKFPKRVCENGDKIFSFKSAIHYKIPKDIVVQQISYPFEKYLEDNKTVAFLIIKNDTIQYEKYWGKYNQSSVVPSFSMAKSVTSILIGCAIDDKLIQSVNEPITNYIPELAKNGFDQVTIEHVLQMTSGLEFKESYFNPFGHAATFYYGTNLRKAIKKLIGLPI